MHHQQRIKRKTMGCSLGQQPRLLPNYREIDPWYAPLFTCVGSHSHLCGYLFPRVCGLPLPMYVKKIQNKKKKETNRKGKPSCIFFCPHLRMFWSTEKIQTSSQTQSMKWIHFQAMTSDAANIKMVTQGQCFCEQQTSEGLPYNALIGALCSQ